MQEKKDTQIFLFALGCFEFVWVEGINIQYDMKDYQSEEATKSLTWCRDVRMNLLDDWIKILMKTRHDILKISYYNPMNLMVRYNYDAERRCYEKRFSDRQIWYDWDSIKRN